MKKLAELSIFFPAYNEEVNIRETVKKADQIAKRVAKKYEIIIINDGSKDKTLGVAKKLAKKYQVVRVINHPQNRGYGAALKSGFYGAKYEWIVFTDADGQFDFSEIDKFVEKQAETKADMVIGYYRKRQVPLYRLLGSKFLWEPAVFLFFGLKVRDIDCAFKLVNKRVIKGIPKLEAERGPFISSELLIKAKRAGFKITEVGISHFARQDGQSTGADLQVIISGFADLFRLRKKLKR